MGALTIQEAADYLGISFSSCRQYGEGRRVVPKYIANQCVLLEQNKNQEELTMAKLTAKNTNKAKDEAKADIAEPMDEAAAMLATAYIQAMARRNPSMGLTTNRASVLQDMAEALKTVASQGVKISAEADQKAG
jgi:hypothetical protein